MASETSNIVENTSRNESSALQAAASQKHSPSKEESAKKRKPNSRVYDVCVTALDGTQSRFEVDKSSKGVVLQSKVLQQLNVVEHDYFGLRFVDEKGVRCWLDIHKKIQHQLRSSLPNFEFAIKFYEPEPARIKDEYTRYLLYLQLRDDICSGRLTTNHNTYALLGSYTAQAELGDYTTDEHAADYLGDYMFAPSQDAELLESIKNLHQDHIGQSPAQAELNFLEVAKKIPLYGVDVHVTQDAIGACKIGVAALGIKVYRDGEPEHLMLWQGIDVVLYKKRRLVVKLKPPEKDAQTGNESAKSRPKPMVFQFASARACKQCYKACVEFHTFFRLRKADPPRRRLESFRLGSSFRYSDRTLYELHNRPSVLENGADGPFVRSPSKRRTHAGDAVRPLASKPKPIEEEEEKTETVADLEQAPKQRDLGDGLLLHNHTNDLEETKVLDPPVQYEEVEVDEANPDYDKYNPTEWELITKSLPDGGHKRYRRRVVTKTVVTVATRTYVVQPEGTEEEMPVMESKPIVKAAREDSDSEKPTLESVGRSETLDVDEYDVDVVEELAVDPVLNAISARLDVPHDEKPPFESEDLPEIVPEQLPPLESALPLRPDVVLDDLFDEISGLSKDLDEEERSFIEEEERRRKEKADRDRILAEAADEFLLAALEAEASIKKHQEEFQARNDEAGDLQHSRADPDFSAAENVDTAIGDDMEFASIGDARTEDPEFLIRTASLLKHGKDAKLVSDPSTSKLSLSHDHSDKVKLVSDVTTPGKRHSHGHDLDGIGDDIRHRPAPAVPEKPRSFHVPDDTPPRASSSIGSEQGNVFLHRDAGSEIAYTVTDTVSVEQGFGGFVKAVREKHESIAKVEEQKEHRLSRVLHHRDGASESVKGQVPTRTISFGESDKPHPVFRTKSPPAIPAKPTVIVPASSELPGEVVFQVNHEAVESVANKSEDLIEVRAIPQVLTTSVIYDQPPAEDEPRPVSQGAEPGVVETHTVQITPPSSFEVTETRHVLTTCMLPTEYITKTITVEKDASALTAEELNQLIEQADVDAGEGVEVSGSVITTTQIITTTKVQKVITGKTITISGEGAAPTEEELQLILQDAMVRAGEEASVATADPTIVVTEAEGSGETSDVDEKGDTEI